MIQMHQATFIIIIELMHLDAAQEQLDVYVSNLSPTLVETNYLDEKRTYVCDFQQWGAICVEIIFY